MAGLCEGGNEPPGSLKANCFDGEETYRLPPWSVGQHAGFQIRRSWEGNLSHRQVVNIKTECVDPSYDLTSEIKFEDTPEPVNFRMVKCEVEDTAEPIMKCEVDVSI
ncbi:hypothetical protein ANN_27446 [Periplaneta americana]|uniref:Uncharacterized protein n=1 Tax=Periplaneta americana TaxID=6978 RepID=A0ABQ8RWA0_PERAM|nr:hypothetical protein ANN_27446 [Periplaneta americana]